MGESTVKVKDQTKMLAEIMKDGAMKDGRRDVTFDDVIKEALELNYAIKHVMKNIGDKKQS